jgi:hypothetical protein
MEACPAHTGLKRPPAANCAHACPSFSLVEWDTPGGWRDSTTQLLQLIAYAG